MVHDLTANLDFTANNDRELKIDLDSDYLVELDLAELVYTGSPFDRHIKRFLNSDEALDNNSCHRCGRKIVEKLWEFSMYDNISSLCPICDKELSEEYSSSVANENKALLNRLFKFNDNDFNRPIDNIFLWD